MTGIALGMELLEFAKSCFVVGMPGGGKSNLVKFLMKELHKRGVHFMVIEPGKMEYRAYKKHHSHPDPDVRALERELEFYSLGNDSLSAVRLAPLYVMRGIALDEHLGAVMDSFYASMPLEGPLPGLIAEALEELYERFPRRDAPPVMADLLPVLDEVMSRQNYEGEVKSNIRAAIDVRVRALTRGPIGKLYQCPLTIPAPDHMVKSYSVVEVNGLSDQALCQSIFSLLNMIRSAVKVSSTHSGGLNFVVILEEAHNIVGPTGDARPSDGNPDPKAYASKYLVRMLAELRSAGVGFIIVDQFPSGVAPEVIQSTATKAAFRLVDSTNRQQIGESMLFGQKEYEEIARLGTGEAFLFAPGYHGPRKISTVNLNEEVDLDPPSDAELLEILKKEKWYRDVARKRVQAEVAVFSAAADQLDKTRLEIADKFSVVIRDARQALGSADGPALNQRIISLTKEIRKLRTELADAMGEFARGPWRRFRQGTAEQPDVDGSEAFRKTVAARYTNTLKPDGDELLRRMESLVVDLDKTGTHRR